MSERSLVAFALRGALVLLVLTGCTRHIAAPGSTPVVDQSRVEQLERLAAHDMACDMRTLRVIGLNEVAFQVDGCGQVREYSLHCTGGRRRASCRWVPITPAPVLAQTEMICPLPQLTITGPEATLREISGCGRSATYQLACDSLQCTWGMVGHAGAWAGETQSIASVGTAGAETTADASAAGAAQPTSEPDPLDAVIIPPPPEGGTGSTTGTAGAGAGAPPTPSQAAIEAQLRPILDQRRDMIHACAGPGAVAVRVAWDATGAVTLHLPSAAGSTAEGCIRAAIGPLSIQGVVAAGEMLHAVP